MTNNYDSLFQAIKRSKKTVVLTGAGISTLSGIPDFRSDKGLYHQKYGSLKVEDILDIDFFMNNPDIFWSWAKPIWYNMHSYQPNIIHKVLFSMEEKGALSEGIYTQNIDGLHERSGSKRVGNLHGSIEKSICTSCHETFTYAWTKDIVDKNAIPMCPYCGGIVKPDIVFYGENLDYNLLRKADDSFLSPDLCIVLGSSLVVQPAASLPYRALRSGAELCLVNRDKTYLNDYASYVFTDLKEWGEEVNNFFRC